MLFLLLLAHLFATDRDSVLTKHIDPRDEPVSCDNIHNCRTLFSIITDCLTTIFVCTWVSVHPNVPPPNQSQLAPLWRRLRLMLLAVIVPELILGFAARQFLDALWFVKSAFSGLIVSI
jgi:hypothetical protein